MALFKRSASTGVVAGKAEEGRRPSAELAERTSTDDNAAGGRAWRRPKVPPLVPIPPIAQLPPAKLQASARYLGTLDGRGERVVGQSLAARSAARLSLSAEALDVVRIAGSFRIPVGALRGARAAETFRGKPVAGLLVIRWTHEDHDWETGFRMEAARSVKDAAKAQLGRSQGAVRPEVDAWVRSISKLVRGNA